MDRTWEERTEARRGEPTVPILDNLFSPQLNNLQSALDKTTRRHALLSNNIANLNTPGFKRQDTDFNIVLEGQMSQGEQKLAELRDQQRQRQSDQTSIRVDGNNVDLEREVMSVAETELRYQALTDMTADYFSVLKNVIREGR
jgi:flagellar basal-body rod protein FlgB